MKLMLMRFKKSYQWCINFLYEASFLVFPSSCLLCGVEDQVLCRRCFASSKYHYNVRSVEGACDILLKGDGSAKVQVFAGARYSYDVKKSSKGHHAAIISYYKKYGDTILKRYLAEVLAKNLEAVLNHIKRQNKGNYDGIRKIFLIPVPGSMKSFIKRGFSPVSEILESVYFEKKCRMLYEKCGVVPEVQDILKLKVRNSILHIAQKNLSARQRAYSQSGVMKFSFLGRRKLRREWAMDKGESCEPGGGERICCIIVDDVLTTGATLNEAYRALNQGSMIAAGQRTQQPDKMEPGYDLFLSYVIECRNAIVLASTRY